MQMFFEFISIFFVISGFLTAVWIRIDLTRHEQSMKIMNPVWTLTGLWASLVGLYAYLKIGRQNSDEDMDMEMNMGHSADMPQSSNFYKSVILSTLHCGAGCTLADIVGEWFTYFFPVTAYGNLLIGQWILDYVLALIFGAAFQYAAIRPMESSSPIQTAIKAIKIDFLSLTAWQIGMYAFTALYVFVFNSGVIPSKVDFEFWFMMQLAMFCGFVTSYPVNILLIKLGIKKAM